eukprot:365985-Rhodomonas_salina.1
MARCLDVDVGIEDYGRHREGPDVCGAWVRIMSLTRNMELAKTGDDVSLAQAHFRAMMRAGRCVVLTAACGNRAFEDECGDGAGSAHGQGLE